jgi:DNA-binding XRE family transcriptional regulator
MRRDDENNSMGLADESLQELSNAEPDKLNSNGDGFSREQIELLRLGRRIRRARKLLGFNQKAFASKCELNRSYFGGVERGESNVTFGILCTICEGLSCDIAAVTKDIPHLSA